MASNTYSPELVAQYEYLFDSWRIKPLQRATSLALCARVLTRKSRYADIETTLRVPWYFTAMVHQMESGGNFKTHLHNGDPLAHRTVHVPAGRPLEAPLDGGAYSWAQSARDALQLQGLHKWRDWSLGGTLFQLERYNGFGYRKRGVPSPYLWAGSSVEKPGKFTGDGVFDSCAVSGQIGAATLLHGMRWLGMVEFAK